MEFEDILETLHILWEMVELIIKDGVLNFILIIGGGVLALYLISLLLKSNNVSNSTPQATTGSYTQNQGFKKDASAPQSKPAESPYRDNLVYGNGFTVRESD